LLFVVYTKQSPTQQAVLTLVKERRKKMGKMKKKGGKVSKDHGCGEKKKTMYPS